MLAERLSGSEPSTEVLLDIADLFLSLVGLLDRPIEKLISNHISGRVFVGSQSCCLRKKGFNRVGYISLELLT
jgi:hypothetical protein